MANSIVKQRGAQAFGKKFLDFQKSGNEPGRADFFKKKKNTGAALQASALGGK